MAQEITSSEVTNKNVASYTLTLSIFSLSGALIYLAILVTEVADLIPGIMKSVDEVTVLIDPIINEVEQIRILVQPVIDETTSIRKTVLPVLKEIKQTRQLIPDILQETARVRTQVTEVNNTLIKTLEILPSVLEEMEQTRIEIPELLTRAERLVVSANEAGEDASEGAVTGFFSGILKAPFSIISNLGESIFDEMGMEEDAFTDEDRMMIGKLSHETLEAGMVGESREWEDSDTGHTMKVSLMHEIMQDDKPCRSLHIEASGDNDTYIEKEIMLCKKGDSEWGMM